MCGGWGGVVAVNGPSLEGLLHHVNAVIIYTIPNVKINTIVISKSIFKKVHKLDLTSQKILLTIICLTLYSLMSLSVSIEKSSATDIT